jgi:hypothetical protein
MGRNITYKDVEDREIRGRAMIRDGLYPVKISDNPEIWCVPSGSQDRSLVVSLLDGRYNCTCEDYRFHGGVLECKHINAVKNYNKVYRPRVSARPDNVIYIDGNKLHGREITIKIIS